jgi:hypothetical protein
MAAAGRAVAPFFRFPDLQHPPQLLQYLASATSRPSPPISTRATLKMHKPDEVIKSVMSQLEKRGKGIILMHDFQHSTAEVLPGLLHQLKEGGYKVVQRGPTRISIDSFEDLPGVADAYQLAQTLTLRAWTPRRVGTKSCLDFK